MLRYERRTSQFVHTQSGDPSSDTLNVKHTHYVYSLCYMCPLAFVRFGQHSFTIEGFSKKHGSTWVVSALQPMDGFVSWARGACHRLLPLLDKCLAVTVGQMFQHLWQLCGKVMCTYVSLHPSKNKVLYIRILVLNISIERN